MTTTARLLGFLSLMLALGACAVRQADAADGREAAPQERAAAASAAPSSAAPAVTPPVAAAVPAIDAAGGAAAVRTDAPAQVAGTRVRVGADAGARPAASAAAPVTPAAPLGSTPVQETPVAAPGAAAVPATPAIATPAAGPVTMPGNPPAGSLLQTLFALIAVLAVLAALAWFLKRYGPKAGLGGGANLRIVGSLNLGGRERLLVVEVGSQWIVVGASPGRVNALATMPKQDGADATQVGPSSAPAAEGPSANNFADWLKQTIDKRK